MFQPYNEEQINEEFGALPRADFLDLTLGMQLFQEFGIDAPVTVSKYEDYGILFLKRSRAGRVLFEFTKSEKQHGKYVVRILEVLLVYKKESQRVPESVLKLAAKRKRES